jgi:hypothetical protein
LQFNSFHQDGKAMNTIFPITRRTLRHSAAAALLLGVSSVLAAQVARPAAPNVPRPQFGGRPPQMYGPRQPQSNPGQRFGGQQGGAVMGPQNNGARTRGEHLNQWMQQHHNMSPQDQERALRKEPGFNQLPQQTQQRMMQRLDRLNSMPPEQRERVLQRGEVMERMSPQQRMQVRGAMGQLSSLPDDRRRAVARSWRELRGLPAAQQNQILNSPQYRQQFSDEERGTLGNLLSVSPLLPQ